MSKTLLSCLLAASLSFSVAAQSLVYQTAKFSTGDNAEWKNPSFDDSQWKDINVSKTWDEQGYPTETHYGWYRFHLPSKKEMLASKNDAQFVEFDLAKVDDADEVFLNGVLIGKTGNMPGDKTKTPGYYFTPRKYYVNINDKAFNNNGENILAVRCYSGGAPGGMFSGFTKVNLPDAIDGIKIKITDDGKVATVEASNTMPTVFNGTLNVEMVNAETGAVSSKTSKKIKLAQGKTAVLDIQYPADGKQFINATVTDNKTKQNIAATRSTKYILTPAAPETPRFNTPAVYGARPGSPIHFRFGVSGNKPMTITSPNLPAGLSINPENGALSGSLAQRGDYTFTVVARNDKGEASQEFTIKVGDLIGLTPPMGWNSWNCWGLSVSQDKVMSSAQALIDKGLADYGYAYINVDDAWESAQRNEDGTIGTNEKFPDMKALGDWLHSNGLKFGIYSSPGETTCGLYLGSLDHELQDAQTFNDWGVDYLKYDWCGYSKKHNLEKDNGTKASYIRPYMLMGEYLRQQPRDIFYSLCQYGWQDVWQWGEFVDANSWRTTGDIVDTWESLHQIGFELQKDLAPYAKPGRWNDPDMLIVGKVGWSSNLRDSRLTPDEQYTHISLWAILAANMLIGCDLAQLDDFTINLLCNNEVNAVNQDILGKQGNLTITDGDIQLWTRPLADGSMAVGIFNLATTPKDVDFSKYYKELGINPAGIRDLWRQQDLSTTDTKYTVNPHGVKFLKVK